MSEWEPDWGGVLWGLDCLGVTDIGLGSSMHFESTYVLIKFSFYPPSPIRHSRGTTVLAKPRAGQPPIQAPNTVLRRCSACPLSAWSGPGPLLCSATIFRANLIPHLQGRGRAGSVQSASPSSPSSGPHLPSSISFLLWAPKPWLSTTTSAWWRNGWVPNNSCWHPQSLRLLLSLVELDF